MDLVFETIMQMKEYPQLITSYMRCVEF